LRSNPYSHPKKKRAAGPLRSNSDSGPLRALLCQTFTLPVGYVSRTTSSDAPKARYEQQGDDIGPKRASEEDIATTALPDNDAIAEFEFKPPLQRVEAGNVENQTIEMREATPVHEGAGLRRSNRM
jgi:hypothetical protein